MNIKFLYRYRDGANYKKHNELIFTNKRYFPIEEIKRRIIVSLIDREFFHSNEFNVPDLHFETWDNEIDHTWHEFIDVEETDETSNEKDIEAFLIHLETPN